MESRAKCLHGAFSSGVFDFFIVKFGFFLGFRELLNSGKVFWLRERKQNDC